MYETLGAAAVVTLVTEDFARKWYVGKKICELDNQRVEREHRMMNEPNPVYRNWVNCWKAGWWLIDRDHVSKQG